MEFFYWLRKIILYKILDLKTYGVRIAAFYGEKVLLVRHRAHHLWVFPGGGIKSGELPEKAATREFYEETGFIIDSVINSNSKKDNILKFFGEFQNTKDDKNDVVYLFNSNLDDNQNISFPENSTPLKKNFLDFLEIAEIRWFKISDLPNNISIPTKNRILEIKNQNLPISKIW
jgi:8-oxo-dGTP pyrophosphatase MutT (NUDIX family)